MKIQNLKVRFLFLCSAILIFHSLAEAQPEAKPLIKRTTYKNEKIDFGAGGTLTVVGAPTGSIIIEGWQKAEVEISAEIEVQAETETDLARLAEINGFMVDQDFGHIRIISVGTNDKNYIKRVDKKLPKNLLDKPFKIDYRIKVPTFCDLEINGGRGDFTLAKVEGAMQIRFLEGNAEMNLTGGAIDAVFGGGNIAVNIASRSWRGRHADIQVAKGNLNVQLLPNTNADINATVLRTGKIENSIESLKPKDRTKFTEKTMLARYGSGGATLGFTVGDGTLRIGSYQLSINN